MKWLFIYRRDLFVFYVCVLFVVVIVVVLPFFISFEYDFHVDAERLTVKTREM